MIDNSDIYKTGMTAEQLANEVIGLVYGYDEPSFPINPFDIITKFGVIYQFMDFEKLEGIYCVPEDEEDSIIRIRNIMSNLKLTAEQAMEALGIAKSDYNKYINIFLEKLNQESCFTYVAVGLQFIYRILHVKILHKK